MCMQTPKSMHAPHTACMHHTQHACACTCPTPFFGGGEGVLFRVRGWVATTTHMHVHACMHDVVGGPCMHACIHVHVRMHACACNICMHACACMQHVHACMTATDSNNSSSASTRNPEASRKKPLSVSMAQKETPKRQERNP